MSGFELFAVPLATSVVPVTGGSIAAGTAGATVASSALAVTVGDVLAVTTGLAGAFGAMSTAGYQSSMAEQAAIDAEADAQASQQFAQFEENRHRDQLRRFRSGQRAAISASGVTLDGSAGLLLEETAAEGEMDALAIRYSGQAQSAAARSQAATQRLRGRSYGSAGGYNVATSLLTGASRIADSRVG